MYIGMDIGGSKIRGVLVEKSGKMLSNREVATPKSAREIDESIMHMIENLATSASVSKIDIKGIGIGTAGSIDKTKGIVVTAPNIKALSRHPLVKNIEKGSGLKVVLENDATIALIGGWWQGHGSKFRNWIMLTLGTGIGGGVIIDNKIYTGQSGNAMEVGHMIIDYNGRKCRCGNSGCLEQYASASALVRNTEELLASDKKRESSLRERMKDEELSAQMIYEEALEKDEVALEVLKDLATYLGIGVANLVNLFNPEAIIFGGGVSEAHKIILPIVKKVVKERALAGLKESTEFLPIKDQAVIPAMGAAKLAIDSLG
jgi:glucokinase